MTSPVLEVRGLRVDTTAAVNVLADISFTLETGEVLGIAGESGCGKSTLGLALLGYSRPGLTVAAGSVVIDGVDILALPNDERRAIRGRRIAYVSQDASKSLNPSMRVRDLILEVMRIHGTGSTEDDARVALARVFLPSDADFVKRFPHQLSGGQQQRLSIGIALACGPSVLVLDEPTTGLDVVTQAHILEEVVRICRDERVACVFISHDLAAMSVVATRIAILYAGRFVEERAAVDLLTMPRHPYSAGLVSSVPVHTRPEVLPGIAGMAVGLSERPTGCAFAPRCSMRTDDCDTAMPELQTVGPGHRVRCLHWQQTVTPERSPRLIIPQQPGDMLLDVRSLRAEHGRGGRIVIAADDVTFGIAPGECLALVGESGSGKSTIARCIAGLHQPSAGVILLSGNPLAGAARDRTQAARQRVQIVFQNPYDSLNPLQTVEEALTRPLQLFFGHGKRAARQRVPALMDQVRLPRRLLTRFPRELSGGERQRVAIARALGAEPQLLICDEVTSALDVSVQAAILNLLNDLDIALLFITHDLGVVASIADRVLVLEHGVVREQGTVEAVLQSPTVEYSKRLIDAIPQLPVARTGGPR